MHFLLLGINYCPNFTNYIQKKLLLVLVVVVILTELVNLWQEVDNLTLRRFLRARDHNVDKAAAMLLKYLKWRREVAPDGFVPEERVRRELAQDKACMGGVDRSGRPILVGFMARHFSADRDLAEFKCTTRCPLLQSSIKKTQNHDEY